jgi:3-(methylthio)propanoyl-CoA dehydrogenase
VANFFTDNPDLKWQYEHGLPWKEIIDVAELGFTLPDGPKNEEEARAFYTEVLTLTGDLAANELAPRAAAIDKEGVRLEGKEVLLPQASQEALQKLREAGLMGLTLPRELGGSHVPLAVGFISNEILARADVSTMSHVGFHAGSALTLLALSALEGSTKPDPSRPFLGTTRFDDEIREIAAGDAWGCMCLTEPDAGSDLAAIRTAAVERDGKWYLTGNKIFITSGHAQYQIVLARSEPKSGDGAFDGLKGLSLFLVRRRLQKGGKTIDNVVVDKVEHKLGHNGSPTCSLVYEDSEGELIGKRGQGFHLMLLMMNGARVSVGFEALGLCEAALRIARSYANDRRSMGKPIFRHELVAEMLMDMELEVAGMRALAFRCAAYSELSMRREIFANRDDMDEATQKRIARYKKRARDLTPLLKYFGGEKAVEHSRKAMQVLGGAGYMQEYGAEKLLRDALVIPVYEGTSQIQALMVMKDQMMGVLKQPARFAKKISKATLGAATAKTDLERQMHRANLEVYRVLSSLISRVAGSKAKKEFASLKDLKPQEWPEHLTKKFMREWDTGADFSFGLLHAERLTKMLCDVEIFSILAEQAAEHPERQKLAERYAHRMWPRIGALSHEIRSNDTSVLDWITEQA